MSNLEFDIPVLTDELLESHDGKYFVAEVIQPRLLSSKIQDAARAYHSDGVEYILEHFDTYFSIIVHGKKLDWNVVNKAFDHILRLLKNLCVRLETVFQDMQIDEDVRAKTLNILKMTVYLFSTIMHVKDMKLADDNSRKLTFSKKGNKSKDNEFCGWTEAEQNEALMLLYTAIQQPLFRLWDPPIAEENFVLLVANPCYNAIEQTIIKSKTVRDTVFQVLGLLIKKYNHGSSCIIKLVQILQTVDHAVSPICAGVVQLTQDFGLGTFGPSMVQEIAEALASSTEENTGAGAEQKSARNCGAFLLELTKELPKQMTTVITTLRPYLETDESYSLRISVLGMMSVALELELSDEGMPDERRALRDVFLEELHEHMHDVCAYVRHKVLQYWCKLQTLGCIPVSRQRDVLDRAVRRLNDKVALVRKAAIQLVKVFIECNPFSAQLKEDLVEKQLATEMKILEDLQKKVVPASDPELVMAWDEIEMDVVEAIKEGMNIPTQDEPDLSQVPLDSLYDSICTYLKEKKYYKAYLVIKHTEQHYPEAQILRCDMEKSDQIEYFVALLRNVFIISMRQERENVSDLQKKIEEQENTVAFYEERLYFCKTVNRAMPFIQHLLMSKQDGDVIEAVEFFTAAHRFNIVAAKTGLAIMLNLVWSSDQGKREAVENAYCKMYLECDERDVRARAYITAKKLLELVAEMDIGGALALQRLVEKWLEKGLITPPLIQVLWEMFLKKIDGTTAMDSYAALALLVMIAKGKPSVALANVELIQTHGLTGDYDIRNLSAQLLQSLAKKNIRYPPDHALFKSLLTSVMDTFLKNKIFTSFASNAINLVYAICDSPDVVCVKLMADMYKEIDKVMIKENETAITVPTEFLIRFIFVLGHVALQQMIFLDTTVYSELRRRNQVREELKEEEKRKKKAGRRRRGNDQRRQSLTNVTISSASSRGPRGNNIASTSSVPEEHNEEEKQKKKSGRRGRADDLRRQALANVSISSASSRGPRGNSIASTSSCNTTMTEDGCGMEGAVADDADAELVRQVCENDIVGENTMLGRYMPLLRHILLNDMPPRLQTAAALTLTRYMIVSSKVCEDSLQLMVTMLVKSKNVALKTNLTMAFADLILRFPNQMQPWFTHIHDILRDEELDVRECAVKMLSYLVLNEMIRAKDQIAEMALCCADDSPRVADITRHFFKQLSLKGNTLYNVMLDIISRLSDPELKVPEDKYRVIMKYLTSLLQKDRQIETLIEKLCQRFILWTEERQWRDLAYCLSLFQYNERSLRILLENIDCYNDKLHCPGVMESFNTLMNNANKTNKDGIKSLVAELQSQIEQYFAVPDEQRESPPPRPRSNRRSHRKRR